MWFLIVINIVDISLVGGWFIFLRKCLVLVNEIKSMIFFLFIQIFELEVIQLEIYRMYLFVFDIFLSNFGCVERKELIFWNIKYRL